MLRLDHVGVTASVRCRAVLVCILLLSSVASAQVGTTFTYQGRLQDNGSPMSGTVDLRFSLWDSATDGSQVGVDIGVDDEVLNNGLVCVDLDFGAAAFSGERRWLEIEVDTTATSNSFETLSPRVEIKPAPYTVFSSKAADANTLNGQDSTAFATFDHGHDLQDLGGAVTDGQIPDDITITHATTASDADTLNGMDSNTWIKMRGDNQAWVVPNVTDNDATNGANLLGAYATAKVLTPNGAPLGASNRAVVIVPPGRYDLGTVALMLDTEFVDLIGLSSARDDQYVFGASNGIGTGVLMQSANNVRIENLFVVCTRASGSMVHNETTMAAYFPDDGTTTDTLIRNCEFKATNDNTYAISMRRNITYPGTYRDCIAGFASFGCSGAASGTFIDCTGGDYSFGGYYGDASGTFMRCTGGSYSFGASHGKASGAFSDCMGGNYAFGGNYGLASGSFTDCAGGLYSFAGYHGEASGVFTDCTGGPYAFGGDYGEASGVFSDCVGEGPAFGGSQGMASGTFQNCTGGDYAFGGWWGTASGRFSNCSGGVFSFAGDHGIADGTFRTCTGGDRSFAYAGTASGTFIDCIGGDAAFGSLNGAASGVFTNCTGGDNSFGYSSMVDGTFTNCTGGSRSFGYSGTASGTFTGCTAGYASFGATNGTASGTFSDCTGGDYSFAGYGGTASGRFTDCEGAKGSFGGHAGVTTGGEFVGCMMTGDWDDSVATTFNGLMRGCNWADNVDCGNDARIYDSLFAGNVNLNGTTAGIRGSYATGLIQNADLATFNDHNTDSNGSTPVDHAATADSATNADHAEDADTATSATHSDSAERVKQTVRDFVVASGQSVTAGDVVAFLSGEVGPFHVQSSNSTFNAGSTTYVSAVALSATRVVVAYRSITGPNYGVAIAGEITGSTITWGAETVFNAAYTNVISATALSSDRFVVGYGYGGSSGVAIVGDVSGSPPSISWGATSVFKAAMSSCNCAALASDKVIVAYHDSWSPYYGQLRVGELTGTPPTISWGSEFTFNNAGAVYISTVALSSGEFVVAYADVGNSYYGTTIAGEVSGTTVSFGTESVFNAAKTQHISAAALSADRFVAAYQDQGNSSYGTAIVGDVWGTVIKWGSESVFNDAGSGYTSVGELSSGEFAVTYADSGNSSYGTSIIGEISGTGILWGTESVFNTDSTTFTSVARLSLGKYLVACRSSSSPGYGKAVLFDIGGGDSSLLGIAGADGVAGETIPVILSGVSNVHAGLAPWSEYYAGDGGTLGTSSIGHPRVGKALSSTELLLKID